MKLCIFRKKDKIAEKEQKRIESVLKKYDVEYTSYKNLKNIECDILLVIGDDRTILDTFLEMKKEIPVLGIGIGGSHFLAEIEAENFEMYIKKILKNNYWVEKRMRLGVKIDEKKIPSALNEIVVSPSKPGVFLRYSLKINDQLVWRDSGDGVIVSTPTGSTSYALSAGGSILTEDSKAIEIVPICSAKMNKPLIVNEEAKICLFDISSTKGAEVLIDGKYRYRLKEEKILIERSKSTANFVRFDKKIYLGLFGKLREKSEKIFLPNTAPPSAKFIYKLLTYEGSMTQKEIINESNLPPRTVRHALNYLLEIGAIERHLTLRDTRQSIYMIKKS